MQLCLDAYVWVADPLPRVLDRFISAYVDADDPGDERFAAFRRVYLLGAVSDADVRALDELRPESGGGGFSLYLRGRDHSQAIITITDEGAAVLGLSVQASGDLAVTLRQAEELIDHLLEDFSCVAGLAGVELPPPQSRSEWDDDGLVLLRVGAPSVESSTPA
ncbi:hypothetical protein ACFFHJ_00460 [Planotetraspora thailandica]|uniref:hypothetical protein n=1 Tax=Planotetraspora thailandica TaxID=487172 RepID=UPI00194E259A|nr:hypothetical protein [Planotetraspora thailandica]